MMPPAPDPPASPLQRLETRLRPWQLALAAAVFAAALLPGLGKPGLLDPWEMDRAAVARRMAGLPRVVVAESSGDKLLATLEKQASGQYALVRASAKLDAGALASLQGAAQRLGREVAHLLVVDADAVRQQQGGGWTEVASQLGAIEAQNRGMRMVLVSDSDAAGLRKAVQQARAKALAQGNKNAATAGWLDSDSDAAGLWPLLGGRDEVVPVAQLIRAVATAVPSPWAWPVHKREGNNLPIAWLDAAVAAVGLSAAGPTEFGARLGGALLTLLTGLLVVLGSRRLFGATGGWCALAVYATLPMSMGFGRILTLEVSPMLGVTLVALGLAQGAARKPVQVGRDWPLWVVTGALVLLLGRGLGGATMAAGMCVAYVLAAADWRPAPVSLAVATLALLGGAAYVVLGEPDSQVLRGLRFTQGAFSAGPDQYHRDFAWFVGQAGFGLFPWGAAVALGLGRLLAGDQDEGSTDRAAHVGAALLIGVVVPFAVVATLIRTFHHLVVPIAGVSAVAAAALLADLLRGKVSGRLAAAFVALSTLLLHREISKNGDALTRFLAFDPPIAAVGATSDPSWPAELAMPRPAHVLALLAVLAFAVGTAKPMATIERAVQWLRTRTAAAWTLAAIGLIWAIDALASLGSKLDVLLKTQAQTTGYNYDRLWVVIQDTRPEVLAAAAVFATLLALAGLTTVLGERLATQRGYRLTLTLAKSLHSDLVALIAWSIGVLMVLGSGLGVLVQLHPEVGYGGALAAGAGSAAFLTPLVLLIAVGLVLVVGKPLQDTDSLWAPLVAGARQRTPLVFGMVGLLAVAGLGIGASQAAGTWSFPLFLIGTWWLAAVAVLTVVGRAQANAAGYAWPAVAAGAFALFVLFGPLAGRYVTEVTPQAEPYKYLAKVLIAAPDSGLLVGAAVVVALNRWVAGRTVVAGWVDRGLALAGHIEQPRWAATALVVAGVCFSGGYAWTLLPGLSVHFSQKHLVARIAESGGTTSDDRGVPRAFAHGAAKAGNDNNFYTQSMPLLEDRQATLQLLAGANAAARISEGGQGGTSRVVAVPGWHAGLDTKKAGQRDASAWFGVVSAADGAKVRVDKAGWSVGVWQGAAVYAPQGQTATVVDNTADTLTLSATLLLTADDATRGWLTLDKWSAARPQGVQPELFAAPGPLQRFVVLPKDTFSELNHAMRQHQGGQHIALVDASSSRLVLATNFLQTTQPDQNWLKKALITQVDLAKEKTLRKIFVNFDNCIHLIGYKLADHSVSRSQKYKMTLYWKVVKATPTSWKLFMHPHPLHLDRWPLTQPDPSEDENKPCNGCFQTNHWMPGDLIADEFEQEVPLGTNSGPNEIIIGYYNPSNDQRLAVLAATGPGVIKHGDNRATIGHLQIR